VGVRKIYRMILGRNKRGEEVPDAKSKAWIIADTVSKTAGWPSKCETHG
jgi:hypothetical protein